MDGPFGDSTGPGWSPGELRWVHASPGELLEAGLRVAVAAAALGLVGAVAAVVAARVAFPYPLEWMEGGLVLHARRVLDGRPLYVEPSLSFTPFIYPPLYAYVSAAVASVAGLGYLPLRLVSAGSTLGAGLVVARLVHRETGELLPATTSVGLLAGSYPLVDTWFDLARVDPLLVVLALSGLYVVRFGRGASTGAAAGVLFALAALTKQSALLVLAPVAVYALVADRRFGVALAGTAAVLVAGATAALQAASGGWFLYYVLWLPTGHALVESRILTFWTGSLLGPLPVAVGFGVAFVALERRRRPATALFYVLAAGGFVGASWQARLHAGGWLNTLIPAYAILAVLFGLGVHRALQAAPRLAGRDSRVTVSAVRSMLLLVVLAQFATLAFAPSEYVPTAADRERGEEVVTAMADLEEPVFSPVYPYLAVRAGHEPVAHKMALVDVLRAPPHDARASLRADVARAMEGHRYGSLAMHRRDHQLAPFTRAYRYEGRLGQGYEPVAGVDVQPRYVFVPDDLPGEDRPTTSAGHRATTRYGGRVTTSQAASGTVDGDGGVPR